MQWNICLLFDEEVTMDNKTFQKCFPKFYGEDFLLNNTSQLIKPVKKDSYQIIIAPRVEGMM